MARPMSLTVLIALLSTGGAAQYLTGAGGPGNQNSTFGNPLLCRAGAGTPNITGSVTIAPTILQGGRADGSVNFQPVTWGVTVYQPSNIPADSARSELSLWFNTNGANYSDNYALGWDTCYFWISPFSLNTFYRGQKDNGQCKETLDATCINDLKTAAQTQASLLVKNPTPGPNSNLTRNSLPGVCSMIAVAVTQNFPPSCARFMGGPGALYGGAPSFGGALTGPDSLVAEAACTTKYGSLMWTQVGGSDLSTYTIASWWVLGIMTLFLPIADYARPVTLPQPIAELSCFKANNFSQGSIVTSDLPPQPSVAVNSSNLNDLTNGTHPTNSTTGSTNLGPGSTASSGPVQKMLGTGAIVGIVIGVLAALALVAGIVILLRRRNARSQPGAGPDARYSDGGKAELLSRNTSVEAPHMNTIYEMPAPKQMMELQVRNPPPGPFEMPAHNEDTANFSFDPSYKR